MGAIAAALKPLDLSGLLLKGRICSAMARAGLTERAPRWEWDGEFPDPCLRITAVVVRWSEVEIRAEELQACSFDQNIPEGTWGVDDAKIVERRLVTLRRGDEWPDVDALEWWEDIRDEDFRMGHFGDVVLAEEPRNLVSV